MTIGIGTSLAKDKPNKVNITTRSGVVFQWVINDTEGVIIDPDISVARITLLENPLDIPVETGEENKESQGQTFTTRIMEVIPWSEILHILFTYDEVPMVASPTVN